jgi:hypothetical protein
MMPPMIVGSVLKASGTNITMSPLTRSQSQGVRQPTFAESLAKYDSNPFSIIDAASRTNAAVNAVGASGAALGVGIGAGKQESCKKP